MDYSGKAFIFIMVKASKVKDREVGWEKAHPTK